MTIEYKGLVPYLFYDDAGEAIEWYGRVFGYTEIGRWPDESGAIRNAEMRVGNTEIWLDGGGKRSFGEDGDARPTWIGVWVEDVDQVFQMVTGAGVEVDPPVTRDFGVRMLTVEDPFGYQWVFMRRT